LNDQAKGRKSVAHNHDHVHTDHNAAFGLGIALNMIYIVAEVVFGLLVNSLALLADAGHNVSDVLGLAIAWAAHYLGQLPPTERRTYGWRSTSILAALTNAIILLIAVGAIVWEAIRRFSVPESTNPSTVMWVAGIGVVVNAVTAMLFLRGRRDDLNIRGAFLHMAADAGVSLGVVAAGAAIYATGWQWLDPAVSLLIAAVILISTWELARESIDLALHAVPRGIDPRQVEAALANLPGVECVHDLHIWAMSTTETALTAHLLIPEVTNDDELLATAAAMCRKRFDIHHVTLQIERDTATAMCRQVSQESI
jgi:cobalt-zinc-cadmium efflux system protein